MFACPACAACCDGCGPPPFAPFPPPLFPGPAFSAPTPPPPENHCELKAIEVVAPAALGVNVFGAG